MPYGVIHTKAAGPVPITSGWSTLKLGAGGQLSSIDINPDGTKIIRADTYGCYIWDAAAVSPGNGGGFGLWRQMVTRQSIPSGNRQLYRNAGGGGWEIRICPNDTNRFYMAHSDGNIYRTDDKGANWTLLGTLPGGPYPMIGNDGTSKFCNYKMAVDPNNHDKVFVATPMNGIFVSTNAGASWTQVSVGGAVNPAFGLHTNTIGTVSNSQTISAGSKTLVTPNWFWYAGQRFLMWQTSNPLNQMQCTVTGSSGGTNATVTVGANSIHGSGTISDWTFGYDNGNGENLSNCIVMVDSSTMYVSAFGIGVWKSTDGGSTWTYLNSTGMPTLVTKLRVDSAGKLWASEGYPNLKVWTYSGTTWTKQGGGGLDGFVGAFIAINPANANQIFLGDSASWWYSGDGGTTWNNRMSGASTRTATDIPYLATIVPFTVSNAVWGSDNIIYISDGVGVWKLLPADLVAACTAGYSHPPVASMSVGIEQLVVNWIISPPGGNPLVACMDRAAFTISDQTKYPSQLRRYSFQYLRYYTGIFDGLDIKRSNENHSSRWAKL